MSITARTRILAAGLAIGTVSIFGAASAGAQETPSPYVGPSSTVAPEVLSNQVTNSPNSAGAVSSAAEVQGSALAFTGGDAAALALVGGTALAAGTGMVIARRRQTANV